MFVIYYPLKGNRLQNTSILCRSIAIHPFVLFSLCCQQILLFFVSPWLTCKDYNNHYSWLPVTVSQMGIYYPLHFLPTGYLVMHRLVYFVVSFEISGWKAKHFTQVNLPLLYEQDLSSLVYCVVIQLCLNIIYDWTSYFPLLIQ